MPNVHNERHTPLLRTFLSIVLLGLHIGIQPIYNLQAKCLKLFKGTGNTLQVRIECLRQELLFGFFANALASVTSQ